jgi:class 3 adenylate cyclase/CHASE2 domain-containing sensor protein
MALLAQKLPAGRLGRVIAGRAATVVVVVVLLVLLAGRLTFIEVRALDVLYALRPARAPDPRVEIIDIGSDPLAYESLRDPRDSPTEGCEVPRRAYAEAVRRLHRWGARVIVFDLMFRRHCRYEDDDLAAAFREAGNVIVAASTQTKPDAVGLQDPVEPLAPAVWAVGSPVVHRPNETVRSVPMVVRDRDSGREYLALSLLAFQRFMGVKPSQTRLSEGHWLLTGGVRAPLLSGERISLLPVAAGSESNDRTHSALAAIEVVRGSNVELIPGLRTWNSLLVNWAGPEGTIRPRLLSDVLAIRDNAAGRRLYRGKAVIIGRADWDEHWTSLGAMPGLEIQANALQTLLSGSFIRPLAPWSMLALVALLVLATTSIVRRLRGVRAIAAAIVLMVLVVALARELLVQEGLWLYVFYSGLSIALVWGMTTAAESGKVMALLGRFVPSFIGKPEGPRAGEVRTMDASILFSDIRGYTGTAEQLSPQDTLKMLNTYHSAVEDIIAKHGGVIVKTPGDAILAVFWQRVRGAGHATCALRAGREILADLPAFAQAWEAAGVGLDIGVGINAGPVAMGLVGKRHLEPTVIGDAVNVAQRLESLTKTLDYQLIFSASVRARLDEDVEAVCLDQMTVAGRKTPITVYGIAGPGCSIPPPESGVDHAQKETHV